MNNLRRLKWVVNQAICDILDHYKNWAELSDNELIELIYKEFRKSDNWFYEDTKYYEKEQLNKILKGYFWE